MKSGSSRIVALLIAISACSTAVAGQGLLVNPSRLYLEGRAGSTIEAGVVASGPITSTSLDGFTLDQDGTPRLGLAPVDRDLRRWMRLEQKQESDQVIMTIAITIPADASGSYWAALTIEAREEGSAIMTRACVPIFVTVTGTERFALRIAETSAREVDDALRVAVELRNEGNTVLRVPVTVIAETDGADRRSEVGSVTEPAVVLLPGTSRTVWMTIPTRAGKHPTVVQAFAPYGPALDLAVGLPTFPCRVGTSLCDEQGKQARFL